MKFLALERVTYFIDYIYHYFSPLEKAGLVHWLWIMAPSKMFDGDCLLLWMNWAGTHRVHSIGLKTYLRQLPVHWVNYFSATTFLCSSELVSLQSPVIFNIHLSISFKNILVVVRNTWAVSWIVHPKISGSNLRENVGIFLPWKKGRLVL